MAIDILYPETHDLAHPDKGFCPLKIQVSHWQLRHYISSPKADHLYYASQQDVYCLNTATKKRKHIATLPFDSRCTASGHGWVCVGGEHDGHFAAIKLDGSGQGTMDVDSALPMQDRWHQSIGQRAATVKVERIGEEIVNSISIHRIQDEEAHLDDIVAVLTNNDKTVRVYSLPAGQETRVKDLPFAINHATISPNGRTLVAVGDFNQAYFFSREIMDTPPQIPKPHNRLTSASVDWRLTNVVTLHCPNPDSTKGYFTTAWSASGHLVAVGSEAGYITVLDSEVLANPEFDDDEAIVAVASGSRPDCLSPHPGAIRSMIFSPEPWDLLVWAEDQGRICIGDLRTGLKSRQVINLEPKEDGLRKMTCEDVTPDEQSSVPHIDDLEADLLRRYRDGNPPDNATAVNFATEYIEARRRQRQLRQDLAHMRSQTTTPSARRHPETEEPQGLSVREHQILDSLRIARQREEARSHGQIPRSVNYTTPDLFNNSGGRSAISMSRATDQARPTDETLSAAIESFPELARTQASNARPASSHAADATTAIPQVHSMQDASIIWGSSSRSSAFPQVDDSSRRPRRSQSGVLDSTPDSSALISNPHSIPEGQSRDPEAIESEQENPWSTIEEQMAAARGPLFEGAARAQAIPPLSASEHASADALQQELETQRRLTQAQVRSREQRERWRASRAVPGGERAVTMAEARRLAAFPDGYETLLRRSQMRGMPSRDVGVRTAGLAMSPDGSTLWAACEDGIFEIRIKVKGRMFWPAIDKR